MTKKPGQTAVTVLQYTCDTCSLANIIPDPSIPFNYISPIAYICPNCNTKTNLPDIYPRMG